MKRRRRAGFLSASHIRCELRPDRQQTVPHSIFLLVALVPSLQNFPRMKSDGLFRHLAIAFAIALVVYAVFYTGIEHRRTRKGPWQVTFTNDVSGVPALVVNQPTLAISNVWISFPGGEWKAINPPRTIAFAQPKPVPFDIPLGECLFMDTTFLPGTVVFGIFGHEIQLIPRVLTIDRKERPWQSDTTISLVPTNPPGRQE